MAIEEVDFGWWLSDLGVRCRVSWVPSMAMLYLFHPVRGTTPLAGARSRVEVDALLVGLDPFTKGDLARLVRRAGGDLDA